MVNFVDSILICNVWPWKIFIYLPSFHFVFFFFFFHLKRSPLFISCQMKSSRTEIIITFKKMLCCFSVFQRKKKKFKLKSFWLKKRNEKNRRSQLKNYDSFFEFPTAECNKMEQNFFNCFSFTFWFSSVFCLQLLYWKPHATKAAALFLFFRTVFLFCSLLFVLHSHTVYVNSSFMVIMIVVRDDDDDDDKRTTEEERSRKERRIWYSKMQCTFPVITYY